MHEAVAGQPNKKARTGEGARLETELGRLVLGLRLGRGEGVLEGDQVFRLQVLPHVCGAPGRGRYAITSTARR